jgi:hypothetical protein
MMLRLLSITLLTLACLFASETESDILLSTGEVVRGEIVAETDSSISLRRHVELKGKRVAMTSLHHRKDIVKIMAVKAEKTLMQRYEELCAKSGPGYEGRVAILEFCKANKLMPQAVTHANEALAVKPQDPVVLAFLAEEKCIEVDGTWMREEDVLALEGKVRVGEKVLTIEEAQRRKEDAKNKTVAYAANQRLEQLYKQRDSLAQRLSDLKERNGLTTLENAITSAQVTADNAKTAVESAQSTLDNAREHAGRSFGSQAARDHANKALNDAIKHLRTLQNAQATATTSLVKARKDFAKAQVDQRIAETKLPELEQEIATLEQESAEANSKLGQ